MVRVVLLIAVSLGGVLGPAAAAWAQAPRPPIRVQLAAGSPDEQQGRDQLLRLHEQWDLSPWLFTRDARVESRAIPHSHPVLTVNTRYLANDTAQLATYIHEQLHWFLVRHQAATDSAVAELQKLFPDAPSAPPDGARDRHSTYLHLIVCQLEYDALLSLFGDDVARRTLNAWRHYRWVYRQVLERPDAIRRVLRRHRLDSPDARAGGGRSTSQSLPIEMSRRSA